MTTHKPIDSDPQHKPSELIEMGLTFLEEARNLLASEVNQAEDDAQWNKLDRQLDKLDQAIEETQDVPIVLRQENC